MNISVGNYNAGKYCQQQVFKSSKSKVITQKTIQTIKETPLPTSALSMGGAILAGSTLVKSLKANNNEINSNKPTGKAVTTPEKPTIESVLSELKEPLIINGDVIIDAKKNPIFNIELLKNKTQHEINDNAFLESIYRKNADKYFNDDNYKNLYFYKENDGKYCITFNYITDKTKGLEDSYDMKFDQDGKLIFLSKSTDIKVSGKDNTLTKLITISPNKTEISYLGKFEDYGIVYKKDENGNDIIEKFHNPMADIMPCSGRKEYRDEINDELIINSFKARDW